MARSTGLAALPADDQAAASPRPLGWVIPWVLAALVFGYFEAPRISEAQSPINWLLQADLDTLTYLGLLCAAPLAWWWHRPQRKSASPGLDRPSQWLSWFQPSVSDETPIPRIRLALLSLFIAGVSLGASATVGSRFENLPPAYHDEYSYLFQAQTFLAGRVSFPSSPAARLFDQMHVLNEGHFASRYFPGTGLWMAPFVACGHPVWGHWLAGAICAVLMFWVARELAGDGAGIIAGLLTALSPAMALFSNLWLAHHPTLVGLSLFLFGYLRMIRTERWSWAMLAGGGLACAMLCRPMTAAGVALPFGIYLVAWAFFARPNTLSNAQSNPTTGRVPGNRRFQRLLLLAGLAFPLLAAGVGMFFYNQAITGSGWLTPYSLYTDLHTPRHVYGFDNVERGKLRTGPRVIKNYDDWAENLTPQLAISNAATRLKASTRWTLGMVPLAFACGAGYVLGRRLGWGTWLVLAGIVSLHLAHIPYWFVGMEDHHYVFEAGPLWSVWVALVTSVALRTWLPLRPLLVAWWGALLTAAVVLNWTISGGTWSAPLEQAIGRVHFAKSEHGRFETLVRERARPTPALVLVDGDPADRHIDYVNNTPDLSGPVLIGRYLPETIPLDEVRRLFPDRHLFSYRIRHTFHNGKRLREEEWTALDPSP